MRMMLALPLLLVGCAAPIGTIKGNSNVEVCAPNCMQYGLTLAGYGQPTPNTTVPPGPVILSPALPAMVNGQPATVILTH